MPQLNNWLIHHYFDMAWTHKTYQPESSRHIPTLPRQQKNMAIKKKCSHAFYIVHCETVSQKQDQILQNIACSSMFLYASGTQT